MEAGRLADLIVVEGDVSADITRLGNPEWLKAVVLNGAVLDLPALKPPPRRDPPGWRVAHYGSSILRRRDI